MADDERLPDGGPRGPRRPLVEKAAVRLRPAQPAGDPPKRAQRRHDVRRPARRCRELVEIENVAFEGFLVRREVVDAIGLPDPSFFIFYDDVGLRPPRPPGRLPDLGGARRGAGAPARLRPAARPGRRGRASTCTATSSSCTSATARTRWSALKPYADHRSPSSLLSPLRGGRAEAGNVIRAIASARGACAACPGSAAARSLDSTRRVHTSGVHPFVPGSATSDRRSPTSSSSAPGSSASPSPSAAPPSSGLKVLVLERRHHLGGNAYSETRPRDRHRGARVRRAPLPHLQREGVGVRQPVHDVHRLPAPGLRQVPGPGLLAADEPRR